MVEEATMKGNRRQVSVRGATYDRLKLEAEVSNKSIAQLVDERVNSELDRLQAQAVDSAPVEG
jgi:hypothetical protein